MLYKILGFTFVALGVIGIFLPVFPTTPFLILVAACFSKSSEKWHQWLLNHKVFGPIIHDWEDNRCIKCRIKVVAMCAMTVFGGISIFVIGT